MLAKAKKQVVVAMSGGVDSSVAAYLLHKDGYDAVGVSMQVWDYRNNGGSCSRATCCSPDDFTDARQVAALIGVPYYVFDFEKVFQKKVIDSFVNHYHQGLTPNPCVECNNNVKFSELRKRAQAIGCDSVATGHYARVKEDEMGFHLLRGVDLDKDQTYFLYGMKPDELSKTLFPVGHLYKAEVREIARQLNLKTADKPESQDICFVSGRVQDFIVQNGGKTPSGDIIHVDGRLLGRHEGIYNYTVGQRKGLNVGGFENPIYVVELDISNNRVVVGSREDLEIESFFVNDLNWVAPQLIDSSVRDKATDCIVQLRHRHEGVLAKIKFLEANRVKVDFVDDWTTVTPGQAAVFYDIDNVEVLGGGKIVPYTRQSLTVVEGLAENSTTDIGSIIR